jgi:Methyltransferase domain
MRNNAILEQVYRLLGLRGTRLIDLSLVRLIHTSPTEQLLNPQYLEKELLPLLGLNDEMRWQYPEDLHSVCGTGILSWQYPIQFSKYLVTLASLPISSYLEIGVRHGGTFVITVEYLRRVGKLRKAIGVDIHPCPSLEQYTRSQPMAKFRCVNSATTEFHHILESEGGFDLVLIDGNHSEEGCRADFEAVRERAEIIVFHDIASASWPGVRRVWQDLGQTEDTEYVFIEFVNQYPSILARGHCYLGLGLAIRHRFWERAMCFGSTFARSSAFH